MQNQPRRRRPHKSRVPNWARVLVAILVLVLLFFAAFKITLFIIGGTNDNPGGDDTGASVVETETEKLTKKLEEQEDTIKELESTVSDLEGQLERYAALYGPLDNDTEEENAPIPTHKPTPAPTQKPASPTPTPKPTQKPTPKPTPVVIPPVQTNPPIDPGYLSEGGI